MIIVSDSGPLAYLFEIGIVNSLPIIYGEVYVPPVVLAELLDNHCPAANWASHPPEWLTIAQPQSIPAGLLLDEGERDAIALAIELGADLLLIDERKGRAAAKSHSLRVAGTLAVILDGAQRGLFDGLTALDKLESTNFYASAELLQAVRDKLAQP